MVELLKLSLFRVRPLEIPTPMVQARTSQETMQTLNAATRLLLRWSSTSAAGNASTALVAAGAGEGESGAAARSTRA